MGRFWDCSILGELNNLGNTIELIEECTDLGYHGVVLNYVININDRHTKGALHRFIDNDYDKIVTYFGQKIKIRKRLTLDMVNPKINHINHVINNEKHKRLMDKFDILAVSTDCFFTNKPFLESIIKSKDVDIINLDRTSPHRKTGLVQSTYFKQLIRECSSKADNKYFEVSLKAFRKNVKNTIFTVNFIGSVIGCKNFIFSTSATMRLECKFPKDLLNVVNLFDSKFKSAKMQNCISKNIEDVLEKSKVNRVAFKQSIESQSLKSNDVSVDTAKCPDKEILNQIEASSNLKVENEKDIKQNTHKKSSNIELDKPKLSNTPSPFIGKKKWTKKKVKKKKSQVKSFMR